MIQIYKVMATQVKLYIQPEGEIRRFTLGPIIGGYNFKALVQHIQQLVERDNFRLFWQGKKRICAFACLILSNFRGLQIWKVIISCAPRMKNCSRLAIP